MGQLGPAANMEDISARLRNHRGKADTKGYVLVMAWDIDVARNIVRVDVSWEFPGVQVGLDWTGVCLKRGMRRRCCLLRAHVTEIRVEEDRTFNGFAIQEFRQPNAAADSLFHPRVDDARTQEIRRRNVQAFTSQREDDALPE